MCTHILPSPCLATKPSPRLLENEHAWIISYEAIFTGLQDGWSFDLLHQSDVDQHEQTKECQEVKEEGMHSKDGYAIRTVDLLLLSPWRPVIYKAHFIHSRFVYMFRLVIKFDVYLIKICSESKPSWLFPDRWQFSTPPSP